MIMCSAVMVAPQDLEVRLPWHVRFFLTALPHIEGVLAGFYSELIILVGLSPFARALLGLLFNQHKARPIALLAVLSHPLIHHPRDNLVDGVSLIC